jgi:pilus assembly protein CpaB
MPIRSLLIGLIAVSFFVILGIFLQSVLTPKPVEQVAAPPKQVLVAAADMPHGRLLRPEDVRWQNADKLPATAIANALATQPGGGPTQVDVRTMGDNVGAITRRDLAAGEVLLTTDVVKPGDRDFLPAVLTPGFRAITVSVDTFSGSAGLIYPGDHVDVVLAQTFNNAAVPIGRQHVGEDIAHNLRVLAIDHYTQGGSVTANNDDPAKRNASRTVTLEATPEIAVKIQVASGLGKLSVILRSLDSSTEPRKDDDTMVWAEDTSAALGVISKLTAPPPEPPKPAPIVQAARQVIVYRGDQVTQAGVPKN